MAAWVLECVNCRNRFEYSKIDDAGIVNYFLPQKPAMPAQGQEVICPQCGSAGQYYFFDLLYRG
jgi:hypothetical protein